MPLSPLDRENFLVKLGKKTATIGAKIPERIEIDGREVRLHDYILKLLNKLEKKELSKEDIEKAKQFAFELGKVYRRKIKRLRSEPMSREEGEALFEECRGIKRAEELLLELDLEGKDINEKYYERMRTDYLEWKRFVESIRIGRINR